MQLLAPLAVPQCWLGERHRLGMHAVETLWQTAYDNLNMAALRRLAAEMTTATATSNPERSM